MGLYTGISFVPGSTVHYTTELNFSFTLNGFYEISSSEKSITHSVFNEWESQLNIDFVFTSNTYAADVFVMESFIDGFGGTLGVNIPYDGNGDGLIATDGVDYDFIVMDYYDSSYFTATLRHEVGHALGLDHDETPGSLMNSRLGGTETITDYDIAKAAAIYGYNKSGTAGAENWTGSQTADRFSTLGGNDVVQAGLGNDTVMGGDGSDILMGESGTDYLSGEAGNDVLYGNKEIDFLDGGAGDDLILGNRENDVLTGGTGADTFFFATDAQGNDTVTDFNAAEGDRLSFTTAYSTSSSGSDLVITHGGGTVTLIGVGSTDFDAGWSACYARTRRCTKHPADRHRTAFTLSEARRARRSGPCVRLICSSGS
jgi:Ca2+-binding RTX toxin-like protein